MKELYRLVYTSSRRPHCTDEEIRRILDACERNNPARNITGVLLHTEKRFLQYMEGEQSRLLELYEIIVADDRHGGANIRDFAPITERMFPKWHMGYKDLDSQKLEFNSAISARDKNIFRSLVEGRDMQEEDGIRVLKVFFELA